MRLRLVGEGKRDLVALGGAEDVDGDAKAARGLGHDLEVAEAGSRPRAHARRTSRGRSCCRRRSRPRGVRSCLPDRIVRAWDGRSKTTRSVWSAVAPGGVTWASTRGKRRRRSGPRPAVARERHAVHDTSQSWSTPSRWRSAPVPAEGKLEGAGVGELDLAVGDVDAVDLGLGGEGDLHGLAAPPFTGASRCRRAAACRADARGVGAVSRVRTGSGLSPKSSARVFMARLAPQRGTRGPRAASPGGSWSILDEGS
jgi:hypothetical protein